MLTRPMPPRALLPASKTYRGHPCGNYIRHKKQLGQFPLFKAIPSNRGEFSSTLDKGVWRCPWMRSLVARMPISGAHVSVPTYYRIFLAAVVRLLLPAKKASRPMLPIQRESSFHRRPILGCLATKDFVPNQRSPMKPTRVNIFAWWLPSFGKSVPHSQVCNSKSPLCWTHGIGLMDQSSIDQDTVQYHAT